jgi:signal transduction protein with GAF and PtsI domain
MALETELQELLARATARVNARFGALALLGPREASLALLLTSGLSEEARAEIGEHPSGRGVLGELLRGSGPIRLEHLPADPRACGVPPAHPIVYGFLGAPVSIDGTRCGSVYFANRKHGVFDEVDERTALAAAAEAGEILRAGRRTSQSGTAIRGSNQGRVPDHSRARG